MKEREDEIEDLFRERFSSDEAPVSPRVWQNIQQTLPEKNRPRFFRGPLLGALLALTIAGAGWGLFKLFGKKENTFPYNNGNSIALETSNPDFALVENKNGFTEELKTQNDRGITDRYCDESFVSENKRMNNSSSQDKQEIFISDASVSKRQENATGTSDKQLQSLFYKGNAQQSGKRSSAKNQDNLKYVPGGNSYTTYPEQSNTNEGIINPVSTSEEKIHITANSFSGKEVKQSKMFTEKPEAKAVSNDIAKRGESDHEIKNVATSEKGNQNKISATEDKKKSSVLNEAMENNSSTKPQDDERIGKDGKTGNNMLASALQNDEPGNNIDPKTFTETKTDSILPELVKDTMVENIIDSVARPDSVLRKEKPKEIRSSRWSVDVLMVPALTGVANKASNASYEAQVASKNSQSKNIFTLSGGLAVNYSVGSNWSVSTGVFYSAYSEKYNFRNTVRIDSTVYGSHIRYDSIFRDSNSVKIFDSIAQTVVLDTTVHSRKEEYSAQKKDRYSFLSFPVNVSYCFLRRNRISLSATAGVRVNLLLKNTTYLSNQEMTGLLNYKWSVQKVSLSYMAAISMEYVLWKNISLLAQPVVNYHGGSVYSASSPIRQRPYSIGINAGVRIRF